MLPEPKVGAPPELVREFLVDYKAACALWHRARNRLDRIADRLDRVAKSVGGPAALERMATVRLTKLTAKGIRSAAPSDRLRIAFESELRRAEAKARSLLEDLRSYIISFSRDPQEAKANYAFFEDLARNPVSRAPSIVAFVEKVAGLDSVHDTVEKSTLPDQLAKGYVPIPRGFGARLKAAMYAYEHTQGKACEAMGGMDPKTLRKLLTDSGAVHQDVFDLAKDYIRSSPRKS
jgi:hypothetical protein